LRFTLLVPADLTYVPATQVAWSEHPGELMELLNFPAAQGQHVLSLLLVPAEARHLPAGHWEWSPQAAAPVEAAKRPAGQLLHEPPFRFPWYLPFAQLSHEALFWFPWLLPGRQSLHPRLRRELGAMET